MHPISLLAFVVPMASSFSLIPSIRNHAGSVSGQKRPVATKIRQSAIVEERSSKRRPRLGRFGRSKKDDDGDAIHMKFVGKQRVATDPISFLDDANLLDEFFSTRRYQELLFPNNNATLLDAKISQELFEKWCKEAEAGGNASGPTVKALPNNKRSLQLYDSSSEKVHVMKITADLQMPSLQVSSETIIGVKLLLSQREKDRDSFPELQFTLLHSKLIPEGSMTAKWIFNQLMKYRDSTSSFTRVTAERLDNDEIVFTTDARLETKVHIPSGIMRYLPPIDVKKFEEQGSSSIQKLLEKDLKPAIDSFANTFKPFVDSSVKIGTASRT